MIHSPCKGCEKRSIEPVNCHTYCKPFLDYRKRMDEINEQEHRIVRAQVEVSSYVNSRRKK